MRYRCLDRSGQRGAVRAIAVTREWSETLELLEASHGAGTRAAVVPSATMAYCGDREGTVGEGRAPR